MSDLFLSYQFWMGMFCGNVSLLLILVISHHTFKEDKNIKNGNQEICDHGQRHEIERRLVMLYDLINTYKHFEESNSEEDWSEEEHDDEEFGWLPLYCKREICKIRYLLNQNEKRHDGGKKM